MSSPSPTSTSAPTASSTSTSPLMYDSWIETLFRGEAIPEREVFTMCEKAKEILRKENNVVDVDAPVTVVSIMSCLIAWNDVQSRKAY